MTLKRDKKREIVRKQLMEKEQESTHSLVSKFSKEMINLIQAKEREVLVSIQNKKQSIEGTPSDDIGQVPSAVKNIGDFRK